MSDEIHIRFVGNLRTNVRRHLTGVPLEIMLDSQRVGPLPYVALALAIVSFLVSLAVFIFGPFR